MSASGTTLDAVFRRSFRLFADRVAVTGDDPADAAWTYAELGVLTDRLAAGLHAAGRRGDRVAVLSETVTAVVVPNRDGVTVDDIAAYCASNPNLRGMHRPRRIEIVDALPRTGSGKLNRPELRTQFP